jgi:hypothetical protein
MISSKNNDERLIIRKIKTKKKTARIAGDWVWEVCYAFFQGMNVFCFLMNGRLVFCMTPLDYPFALKINRFLLFIRYLHFNSDCFSGALRLFRKGVKSR